MFTPKIGEDFPFDLRIFLTRWVGGLKTSNQFFGSANIFGSKKTLPARGGNLHFFCLVTWAGCWVVRSGWSKKSSRVPHMTENNPNFGSFLEGKWDPGCFRKIQVGDILFHLARYTKVMKSYLVMWGLFHKP